MDEEIMENSPEKQEESKKSEEEICNPINDCPMKIIVNMDKEKKDVDGSGSEDSASEDSGSGDSSSGDSSSGSSSSGSSSSGDSSSGDSGSGDSGSDDSGSGDSNSKDSDSKDDNAENKNTKNDDAKGDDAEDDDTEGDDTEDEGTDEDGTEDDGAEDDDAEEDEAEDDEEEGDTDESDDLYSGWTEKSTEEKVNEVRKKLILTAQMERLNDYVDARLIECGWKADIINILRAEIKKNNNLTLENLYDCVMVKGKELVPESLKDEVLDKIQALYEADLPNFNATYSSSSEEEDSDGSLTL